MHAASRAWAIGSSCAPAMAGIARAHPYWHFKVVHSTCYTSILSSRSCSGQVFTRQPGSDTPEPRLAAVRSAIRWPPRAAARNTRSYCSHRLPLFSCIPASVCVAGAHHAPEAAALARVYAPPPPAVTIDQALLTSAIELILCMSCVYQTRARAIAVPSILRDVRLSKNTRLNAFSLK